MNAVIALCHFCETHGPSVLFCTQAFHGEDEDPIACGTPKEGNVHNRKISQSSGSECSVASSQKSSSSRSIQCEACRSIPSDHPGFRSIDEHSEILYMSCRNPAHQDIYSVVRQACVRSLSCEICPGREGPIFFGEDANGYVLSHTFFLKDSQARGLQRWYSIIIVMMDRVYLINSWSFLVKHFKQIIDKLQAKAWEVFNSETDARFERSRRSIGRRHITLGSDVLRRQHRASFRAIENLTCHKHLFHYLHLYFSWILKAGANRVTERVLEGAPREELLTDFEAQDMEETLIPANVHMSNQEEIPEKITDSPRFSSLRQMLQVLSQAKFRLLAFNVVQGNQLIVRGKPESLVLSIFETLKILIPNRCFKCVPYSDIYQESWTCNFLGLRPGTSIPEHILESHLYTLMDIKENGNVLKGERSDPLGAYTFEIHGMDLVHGPQILKKIEEALLNKNFTESVLSQYLCALKEEWMDKVKVIFKFSRSGPRSSEEKERLFKILHAKPEDEIILKFWMTGFNKEYRSHLLTCSQMTSIN